MNKYLIKQIRKAIERNNYNIPNYIDTYNANPTNDVCVTITTSTGKWGGIGSLMILEKKMEDKIIKVGNHGTGQAVCIKNNTKKGYSEAEFGDGIDISARMENHRGTVQKGLSQTIKTQIEVGVLDNERERERESSQLRIRKLTPKECMRLMGFQDEDYESLVKAGLSDSGIYHIAGDSIVVSVLIGIFGEMFNSYDIEKYVEEIKK